MLLHSLSPPSLASNNDRLPLLSHHHHQCESGQKHHTSHYIHVRVHMSWKSLFFLSLSLFFPFFFHRHMRENALKAQDEERKDARRKNKGIR